MGCAKPRGSQLSGREWWHEGPVTQELSKCLVPVRGSKIKRRAHSACEELHGSRSVGAGPIAEHPTHPEVLEKPRTPPLSFEAPWSADTGDRKLHPAAICGSQFSHREAG